MRCPVASISGQDMDTGLEAHMTVSVSGINE